MYVVVSVVTLALVIGALADIITRQDGQVKHLPKLVWVLLVVFLPLIGSILWFVIGREYSVPAGRPFAVRSTVRRHPEQHSAAPSHGVAESTEEQLLRVEREIEFYEKQARIEKLQAEAERRRLETPQPGPVVPDAG